MSVTTSPTSSAEKGAVRAAAVDHRDRAPVVCRRSGRPPYLRWVSRAHGQGRVRRGVRPRQPSCRPVWVSHRRPRAAPAARDDHDALSRWELRLGLPLARWRRAGRAAADRPGARLEQRGAEHVRDRRVPRPVRANVVGTHAGGQPGHREPRGGAGLGRILQRTGWDEGGRPPRCVRPPRSLRRRVVVPRQRDGRTLAARSRLGRGVRHPCPHGLAADARHRPVHPHGGVRLVGA